MNHFEFGFFDELEKIATDPAVVAKHMEIYRQKFPHASKGELGASATRAAQAELGTSGRRENMPSDPRFAYEDGGIRFGVSIPDKDRPGQRVVANREQRNEFRSRLLSPSSFGRMKQKYMPFKARQSVNLAPYGLR